MYVGIGLRKCDLSSKQDIRRRPLPHTVYLRREIRPACLWKTIKGTMLPADFIRPPSKDRCDRGGIYMNRIYKVIWSKVKHQYIVVSELAHSCTKSTSSRAGRSAAAVLAALILTTGVCAVPAQAADPTLEELYYEQLNSTVHNDETSSPVVKLVEAPTAVPTAAKRR